MKKLGNYISLHIAYSKDEEVRNRGTSGGVVSAVLINALNKKIIDAAVVIGMNDKEPWKPEVKIAKSRKEILSAAGSKYILIPIQDILGKIYQANGKLAVVGLPCHISVIRNMMEKGKIKNVRFLIGLFCGYNMPAKATDFLIKKSGVKKKDIELIILKRR